MRVVGRESGRGRFLQVIYFQFFIAKGVDTAFEMRCTALSARSALMLNAKAAFGNEFRTRLRRNENDVEKDVCRAFYLRRRRAASPASASRESVAVVGSGMSRVVIVISGV